MIDLVQCRAAIGPFASVCSKQNELINEVKGVTIADLYEQYQHMPHVLLYWWKNYLLEYLGIYITINEAIVKWKLLLLSNDISENPGPEF